MRRAGNGIFRHTLCRSEEPGHEVTIGAWSRNNKSKPVDFLEGLHIGSQSLYLFGSFVSDDIIPCCEDFDWFGAAQSRKEARIRLDGSGVASGEI